MISIDWSKVVTSAVCALVVSAVLGAAAIIWTGATTVGDKITASETRLLAAIEVMSQEFKKANARLTALENKDEIPENLREAINKITEDDIQKAINERYRNRMIEQRGRIR